MTELINTMKEQADEIFPLLGTVITRVFGDECAAISDSVNFSVVFKNDEEKIVCSADVKDGDLHVSKPLNFKINDDHKKEQDKAIEQLNKLIICFEIVVEHNLFSDDKKYETKKFFNWVMALLSEIMLTPLGGLDECQNEKSLQMTLWFWGKWFPLRNKLYDIFSQ